jgi:molybdenum transport protein
MSLTCHVPDSELEELLLEDAPYGDLTTELLGIGAEPGRIIFTTRHDTVVACTEEAGRLLEKTGCETITCLASGSHVPAKTVILEAAGTAAGLHLGWKVAVNLLESACGIATRTRRIVEEAKRADSSVSVVATRKIFPGTKRIATKAVYAGGALPHRLGLSETILIFDHHRVFIGDFAAFLRRLDACKYEAKEKTIAVEVAGLEEALLVAGAGADILQVDKLPPQEMAQLVQAVRATGSPCRVAAAGGINEGNAYEYASTGVDILVTSAMYWGKPADIGGSISRS